MQYCASRVSDLACFGETLYSAIVVGERLVGGLSLSFNPTGSKFKHLLTLKNEAFNFSDKISSYLDKYLYINLAYL